MILTGLHTLSTLDTISENRLDDLIHGRILSGLASATFWRSFPALPHPGLILNLPALILVAPLLLAIFHLTRHRYSTSLPLTSLLLAAMSLVPLAAGRLILLNNTQPEISGPWIALMLNGMLYCLLCSMAPAVISLMPSSAAVQPPRLILHK